mgnify:FL=1
MALLNPLFGIVRRYGDPAVVTDFIPYIPAIITKKACEPVNVVTLDMSGISAPFTLHN